MTQWTVDDMNAYLIRLAESKAGIRRKLLDLKKFIETVEKNIKENNEYAKDVEYLNNSLTNYLNIKK